jgi:two-component sensor histidine kinase
MTTRLRLAFSQSDPAARANHRIGNNLSVIAGLVRMRASNVGAGARPFECEEVQAILAELGGQIDAVARLHRRLGGAPEEDVDIGEYLREVSGAVVGALSGGRQVRLTFACDQPCFSSPERALTIGLIVVELLTNAVKYAHPTGVPGEVDVACVREEDGAITVSVRDDGVGLPEGMDPMNTDSLGLRLVRSMAAQLSARIQFIDNELGLACALQMPGERRA